jgi:tetratricopeptide (TPR) repeat protein
MSDGIGNIEKHQVIFLQTGQSFVDYYLAYAQTHQDDLTALDEEFDNFTRVRLWLVHQKSRHTAQLLLALIKALTTYLHRPEFATELLAYCQAGLPACRLVGVNPGWLLLLRYEAHNYLGEWDYALADAQAAIKVTQAAVPQTHAQAMLALGCLQFNRGDYRVALDTLAQAEDLLTKLQDWNGVASARAQVAAYHLNRGELDQALTLYQEIDLLRRRIDPAGPTDHTLLMLGVVYREKQDYQQATAYLRRLLHRGEAQGKLGVMATASHHLAWVQLRQKNETEAHRLATQARHLYLKIGDPRGASDADEQLGVIASQQGNIETAISYVQRALEVRQQLGNQQGTASCLGHLAELYARSGSVWRSLAYLWRSWLIYQRLGMMNRKKLLKRARQIWRLGTRRTSFGQPHRHSSHHHS